MSEDESPTLNDGHAVIRDAIGSLPPKAIAAASLRSAAETIDPNWTAADCIAHLIMLAAGLENMR